MFHKQTPNFVDIEVPANQIWFNCSSDAKEDIAFLSFYTFDGKNLRNFFYRKPLRISQCQNEEQEYRVMLKGAKTARIVGLRPLEESPPDIKGTPVPEHFKNAKNLLASVFIRLQVQGKCKSFFEDDCSLPENYWGGTIPQ